MQRVMDERVCPADYHPLCRRVLPVFAVADYRNENMCLELMLIAAAANT